MERDSHWLKFVMWHILANEMGREIWRFLGELSSLKMEHQKKPSCFLYKSTSTQSQHTKEVRAEKWEVLSDVIQSLNYPTQKSPSFITSMICLKNLLILWADLSWGFSVPCSARHPKPCTSYHYVFGIGRTYTTISTLNHFYFSCNS